MRPHHPQCRRLTLLLMGAVILGAVGCGGGSGSSDGGPQGFDPAGTDFLPPTAMRELVRPDQQVLSAWSDDLGSTFMELVVGATMTFERTEATKNGLNWVTDPAVPYDREIVAGSVGGAPTVVIRTTHGSAPLEVQFCVADGWIWFTLGDAAGLEWVPDKPAELAQGDYWIVRLTGPGSDLPYDPAAIDLYVVVATGVDDPSGNDGCALIRKRSFNEHPDDGLVYQTAVRDTYWCPGLTNTWSRATYGSDAFDGEHTRIDWVLVDSFLPATVKRIGPGSDFADLAMLRRRQDPVIARWW